MDKINGNVNLILRVGEDYLLKYLAIEIREDINYC